MPTILTKKKDTAGAPSPGDLTNSAGGAELAVNTFDKRLYTKDAGGNVVEIGTNPSIIDTTTVDTTNLEVTNIKAKDGTASATIANSTGVMTIGSSVLTTTDINGGTIDATTIGGVTPAAGSFTTVTATTGNITTVDATNVEVTNIKAKDGTASISLADSTGIATFSKATVVEATDNTNAALRITQLGTGNALLVEDSTNPDATPFVVDQAGQVGIGTNAPSSNLQVTSDSASTTRLQRNSTDASAAGLFFVKQRGTLASPSIVSSGDVLGTTRYYGNDGTAIVEGARIDGQVDGTPGTNDMPGRLVFSTTADGASTPTERMRIRSDGGVSIGGAGAVGYTLLLQKGMTGAATVFGMSNNGQVQSDATTSVYYYRTSATTAAAAFTVPNLYHYHANQSAIGAGSSVTSQYGFAVGNTLIGATNNYGFHSDIASGSNRWNFYADGTAANYFAGNVGIGTTTTTAAQLTIAGNSSTSALKIPNIEEVATISATAATGTINYDITTQSVLFYTSNASANWTVNFRGSSGTSLNTLMATGESMSVTFLVTQGATAYYNSVVQVDGTTSGVTTRWQGGTAPTSGNASSLDSYTYVIIKTGSATFTVLAAQTRFA